MITAGGFSTLRFALAGVVCLAMACSDDGGTTNPDPNLGTADSGADAQTADAATGDMGSNSPDAASDSGTSEQDMRMAPGVLSIDFGAEARLEATLGAASSLQLTARLDDEPVAATWTVDDESIATVATGPAETVELTSTDLRGGTVLVTATVDEQTVEAAIFVALTGNQNGYVDQANEHQVATDVAQLKQGGGIGGVGGEGLGVEVTDAAKLAALDNPTEAPVELLYPYDGTRWPLGLPAPLLQWRSAVLGADAIKISLSTQSGTFSWSGTFGPPAVVSQTNIEFERHPIPQTVWDAALASSTDMDDLVTMELVVEKNGVAYGPTQQTWSVVPSKLPGTIRYTGYGNIAKNFPGAVGSPSGMFGGAIFSVVPGQREPLLEFGSNGDTNNCRACHSASADGSAVVAQNGQNTALSIAYLNRLESALTTSMTFPAIRADGSHALAPAGTYVELGTSTTVPVTGLDMTSTNLGTPSFSVDGTRLVFNPMASGSLATPTKKLVVTDFDDAAKQFSNPVVVVDLVGEPAEHRPGWARFTPDGNAVIFQRQLEAGFDGNIHPDLRSRKGARAQIQMVRGVDGTANVLPLDRLNGVGYLPSMTGPNNWNCTGDGVPVGSIGSDHSDDANLNYQPAVSPVQQDGVVWVAFVSRRMYGNVADIAPFCSDPRGVDLFANITTKKIWVAAIDLNDGTVDPSYPAFYLPGQELLGSQWNPSWSE